MDSRGYYFTLMSAQLSGAAVSQLQQDLNKPPPQALIPIAKSASLQTMK